MLDLKYIRENIDKVKKAIENKNEKADVDKLLALDSKYRKLQQEIDSLRHTRNKVSKEIALSKTEGKDEPEKIKLMRDVGEKIKTLEKENVALKKQIDDILIWVPNIPHSSVPVGSDSSSNKIIKQASIKPLSFNPLPHWELTKIHNLVNFQKASKVSGANFPCYMGIGAKLERALINFMLDVHTKNGYKEVFVPFIVNRKSMFGTGQLPKLEEDMYLIEKDEMFLNPTAEVPITNLHREEIIKEDALPIKYVGYTACFRREAGSYGKDTKGRRANIRLRKGGKLTYPHTLNGSGLATPRTFIAIVENYQQKDGTIKIPEALIDYMNGIEIIEPPA
ncbi:MAG: serine--tRNA ligase [Candidatus Cloacimonas sp. 4484_209]|nr:MAG: serine--tRNA ligase [Candidatus Cloacimonas sp. 4484_209]